MWKRIWSRLFIDQEVLVVVNTDEAQPVTAYSTVAPTFRVEGDKFHLIYWHAPKSDTAPPSSLTVERRNEQLAVRMTLPPAGFAIYQAAPGLDCLGPSPPPDLKPWTCSRKDPSLRKVFLGSTATMGGVDALVFTAGVGEHAKEVRASICAGLECLGLELDAQANASCLPDADVARPGSRGRILIITTREDVTMLREMLQVLEETR